MQEMDELVGKLWSPHFHCYYSIQCLQVAYGQVLLLDVWRKPCVVSLRIGHCPTARWAGIYRQTYGLPVLLMDYKHPVVETC